jgi:hypothetical protein
MPCGFYGDSLQLLVNQACEDILWWSKCSEFNEMRLFQSLFWTRKKGLDFDPRAVDIERIIKDIPTNLLHASLGSGIFLGSECRAELIDLCANSEEARDRYAIFATSSAFKVLFSFRHVFVLVSMDYGREDEKVPSNSLGDLSDKS